MLSYDYLAETLEEQTIISRFLNETVLIELDLQYGYLTGTYNSDILAIKEEAVAETKKSLWQRIKDWFKKVFGIFTNNSKEKSAEFRQWYKENTDKVNNVVFNGVSAQLFRYAGEQKMAQSVDAIFSILTNIVRSPKDDIDKIHTKTEVIDKYLSNYLDTDSNFTNGIKTLFRAGSPKAKLTYSTVSGKELENLFTQYVQYCNNYDSKTLLWLEMVKKKIETDLQYVERKMGNIDKLRDEGKEKARDTQFKPEQIKASSYHFDVDNYSQIIENMILTEAKTPIKKAASYNNSAPDTETNRSADNQNAGEKDTVNPTDVSVTVNGEDYNKQQKKNDDKNKKNMDKEIPAESYKELELSQSCIELEKIVISAAMTIAEEMFNVYFKLIKSIVGAKPDTTSKSKKDESSSKKEDGAKDNTNNSENPKKKSTTTV